MTDKFIQLTRRNVRNLRPGSKLREHGIEFERLPDGDPNTPSISWPMASGFTAYWEKDPKA